MSASEKLKTLSVANHRGADYWDRVTASARIREALPQLKAVVEAAERKFDGSSSERATPTAMGKDELYDALAALNEALGGVRR